MGSIKKSDVIIFDESTNAIDKKSENNILSLLKIKSNKIILLISHSQNVLDYSDISIFMKDGKIIK